MDIVELSTVTVFNSHGELCGDECDKEPEKRNYERQVSFHVVLNEVRVDGKKGFTVRLLPIVTRKHRRAGGTREANPREAVLAQKLSESILGAVF